MTCIGQCALNDVPSAVERNGRPNECRVVLKTKRREPREGRHVRLGEGKLQDERKPDLHGTGSLPASSRRAVNSPTFVTAPCVTRLPLCRTNRS